MEERTRDRIKRIEYIMLAYGAICTFLIVLAMSRNLIFSCFMVPAGIGGTCISLLFVRKYCQPTPYIHLSPQLQTVGISIMPLTVLTLCILHAWNSRWMDAGLHLMVFGFLIFVVQQHLRATWSYRNDSTGNKSHR